MNEMRVDFYENKSIDEPIVIVQAPCRSEDVEELIGLISNYSISTILGYSERAITKLRKDMIVRFYSKEKKTYADTTEESFLIKVPLYKLESELPRNFVRISNSEIINTDRIIKLDISLTGTIKVLLEGGIESRVSRRYMPKVKGALI